MGERFRSGGAHGIARFLGEHQDCNSGFDVRRDEGAGSGRLRITCEGCGATVDYRAAEAGELAAGGLPTGTVLDNGEPPPPAAPPPMPAARQPAGIPTPSVMRRARMAPAPPPPRRGRIPSWIPVALIAALILGGLTMIAIGLTKEDEQPPTGQPSGQGADQTAPDDSGQGAQPEQPAQPEPQAPEPSGGAVAPAGGAGAALNRRTFENRFAIGVPAGWEKGIEDGGIAITAPGSTAEIVVFFEQGGLPVAQLGSSARGFLAQRHRGAQVGAPQPIRVGPSRGLKVVATYQGGEEVAVVVSASGFSHVVLRRIDRGASPDLVQQAEASLASFRPR